MICTSIGPFEIVKELAIEGSVCVYKAVDSRSGRTVALRTLNPSAGDPDLKAQVLQRAKLASGLDSPNIASTYGAGSADGLIFVATEYVDGVSLRALLAKQKKFSIWDLLDYTRQVQMALDHARQHGVVHLNLHPGTIMIELDGTLKILNFGILGPETPALSNSDSARYFSPEQIQGEPLDTRSNLYSWGAILYEAVTGARLFAGKDGSDLCQDILSRPPMMPEACREGNSAGACDIILKLLSKSPDERFQCGGDVVRELESAARPAQPQPKVCSMGGPAVNDQGSDEGSETEEAKAAPVESPAAVPAPHPQPPRPVTQAVVLAPPAAPVMGKAVAKASPVDNSSSHSDTPSSVVPKSPAAKAARKDARPLYAGILAVLIVAIALLGRQLRGTSPGSPDPLVTTATPADAPVDPAPSQGTYSDPNAPVTPAPKPKAHRPPAPRVAAPPPAPLSGDLVVSSTPAGAQVRIDNDSRSSGITPFIATALTPGAHTVTIMKDGYANQAHKVIVEAGRRLSFDVTLTELEAVLAIDSDPQGATVIIDGRNSGSATPSHIALAKGSHSIRLQKTGFFEAASTVQLSPGVTTRLKPALVAMGDTDSIRVAGGKLKRIFAGSSQSMASLQVRSLPRGARIVVNGREIEKPTPAELSLAPGNYQITISLDGYKPVRKMVTVSAISKAIMEEALEPASTPGAK